MQRAFRVVARRVACKESIIVIINKWCQYVTMGRSASAAGSTPLPDNSHCISDNNQPTVGILAAHLASKQVVSN